MSSSARMNQHISNKAVEPNEFRATGDFVSCCDSQAKMWFFPNYLWRLDHATPMNTFLELVGDVFVWAEATPEPGKAPSPAQALARGDGRGNSPTLPDSSQQRGEQCLPTGFAGCQRRRAERRGLTASVRHDCPFPSSPPSPLCGQWLSGVSCPMCSYSRQRWEKRERSS